MKKPLRKTIEEIIKDVNMSDEEWVKKYGDNFAWDAILSAIREAMPKEKTTTTETKPSDYSLIAGWNAYRQELVKKLA